MALVADADGKITGQFSVPPNIPVGTKLHAGTGDPGIIKSNG